MSDYNFSFISSQLDYYANLKYHTTCNNDWSIICKLHHEWLQKALEIKKQTRAIAWDYYGHDHVYTMMLLRAGRDI